MRRCAVCPRKNRAASSSRAQFRCNAKRSIEPLAELHGETKHLPERRNAWLHENKLPLNPSRQRLPRQTLRARLRKSSRFSRRRISRFAGLARFEPARAQTSSFRTKVARRATLERLRPRRALALSGNASRITPTPPPALAASSPPAKLSFRCEIDLARRGNSSVWRPLLEFPLYTHFRAAPAEWPRRETPLPDSGDVVLPFRICGDASSGRITPTARTPTNRRLEPALAALRLRPCAGRALADGGAAAGLLQI